MSTLFAKKSFVEDHGYIDGVEDLENRIYIKKPVMCELNTRRGSSPPIITLT